MAEIFVGRRVGGLWVVARGLVTPRQIARTRVWCVWGVLFEHFTTLKRA